MGVAMQGLSKIFRAPIIKIIGYRAHRAVIFAIAWHLVSVVDCRDIKPQIYPGCKLDLEGYMTSSVT